MAKKNYSSEPYIFKTLSAFAIAYFITFILGTILVKIGGLSHFSTLTTWGNIITGLLGPALGVAVAYKSNVGILGLISSMMAGTIIIGDLSDNLQVGLPLIAFLTILIVIFCINMIEHKTPLDIFLIPILSIVIAGIVKVFISPYVILFITYIVKFVNEIIFINPLLMGMSVSLIMGIIFSTPITMIAITSILNFNLLACGAALAGTMSFMIGMGLMSLQDNDIGDSLAVLLGTPILQFSNMIKHPIILIPPIISSLVCGALSTVLFKIPCTIYGAAMGGTALIGISEAINIMGKNYWVAIILCDLILPIVINYSIYQLFRKARYIRNGDLKILK